MPLSGASQPRGADRAAQRRSRRRSGRDGTEQAQARGALDEATRPWPAAWLVLGPAQQGDREAPHPGGEVVVLDVPHLVRPPGHPGHVEVAAEDDDVVGDVQRVRAQALLARRVEAHLHEDVVTATAGLRALCAGGADLDLLADQAPQQARCDLGRARVVADEEDPRPHLHGATLPVRAGRRQAAGRARQRRGWISAISFQPVAAMSSLMILAFALT